MNAIIGLFIVLLLLAVSFIGVGTVKMEYFFGVVMPYAAMAIFILGVILRVLKWAKSPVPFRIPTSCGQQKSMGWVKNSKLDNPHNGFWTIARMALEILTFRSLFRNTKASLEKGPKLVYGGSKWLWVAALAFHYSFLVIVIRHFRFFTEPIPGIVLWLQSLDSLFQISLPLLFMTDILLIGAATYLFLRRVVIPQIRYISLAADFIPLFLILSIAVTGVLMRYFIKVDAIAVKQLAMGLLSFSPVVPEGIGVIFYMHLFLVSFLLIYFPFSKLMHMGGIFLSPARNLANNNRAKRHINPWNPDVKIHTYEEYEEEFKDVMKAAGMPLEKE